MTKSTSCVSPPVVRMTTVSPRASTALQAQPACSRKPACRAGALHGVRRRELSHPHDLPDEAPLVDVGEIAEVAQEPHELGPAVGVDVDQARTAKAEDHLARAGLERGGGVVEGRRARAQHRHALAGQRREVDLLAGVRVEPRRQPVADHRRDLPLPRAVDPGRQHDPPRAQRLLPGVGPGARVGDGTSQAAASAFQRKRPDARVRPDGNLERPPVPGEVGRPGLLGDEPHRLPAAGAVLRLVPGARREAGDAEIGSGQVLRRAQRPHAREVEPGPGAIERVVVDDQHVRDALACEPERRGETALPRAHDQDVEDVEDPVPPRPPRVGIQGRRG